MGLNILLKYSDVASMTLHFFHQVLVQHVIQLQFLQVFLENLFIFSDEVKKELPEAHIFFQNPAKMVLSWLVKGLLKLFNKGGSFHNAVNLSWIYVMEGFRWWNRIHFKWKFCARRVTSSWALTWMSRRFCWMAIKSKQPRSFATKVPISNAPGLTGWFWWILRLSLAPVDCTTWVFPKIGVSQNGWFIMENTIKWMIWGYPYFWKHPLIYCGIYKQQIAQRDIYTIQIHYRSHI